MAIRSYVNRYLEPDKFTLGKANNSPQVHSLCQDSNQLATYYAAADGDRNRFKLRLCYCDDDPRSPVFFAARPLSPSNDDWSLADSVRLTEAFARVGAFRFVSSTSRDAALLLTLEPGADTVPLTDATGATGSTLAEVYEVP